MSTITHQQMIDCVAREIKMREYVYPGRVAAKKMRQHKADHELEAMRAVLAHLIDLQATEPRT